MRSFLVFVGVLLSLELASFAGSSTCPFTKQQLDSKPEMTPQEVSEKKDLFIYHGLVYEIKIKSEGGLIPNSHESVLAKKKNLGSILTDEDVNFHPNLALARYLQNFDHVVGRLVP